MRNAIVMAAIAALATGCASPRYFGDGRYVAADYSKAEAKDDRFNEYDSRTLFDNGLAQLSKCAPKPQIMMLERFDNQTSEMIDTVSLQRELNDRLSHDGWKIIDKSSRPDLHNEYEYQKAGYTDPTKAARTGKQEGVNLMLRAVLVSKVQEEGNDKSVRYRLSLQTVDAESSLVMCSVSTEIKKEFERVRYGL